MPKASLYIAAAILGFIVLAALIFLPKKTTAPESSLNSVADLALPTIIPTTIPNPKSPNPTTMTKQYDQAPTLQIDTTASYSAVITTSQGPLTLELFASQTPITVNNFVFLARDGFYDGTVFHRIIRDFMIQGGDPQGTGTGGPGYSFADEPITRDYSRGIVAMANSGPDTNGSQFFIMTKTTALPKNYVIFGQLTGEQSLATLDKLASTPVTANSSGENSKPVTPPSITSVKILEQ